MFKDLVMKSRSCRGFDSDKKVKIEDIKTLISYVRYCPQARNLQALKYRIVTEDKEVKVLQDNTVYGGALPKLNLPFDNQEPTSFIVICLDKTINDNMEAHKIDIGIVAQTILLGAQEMGIDGIMIGSFHKKNIQEGLALDENYEIGLVIPLGYSVETTKIVDYETGSINYYRDSENVHYIPKRKLEELII